MQAARRNNRTFSWPSWWVETRAVLRDDLGPSVAYLRHRREKRQAEPEVSGVVGGGAARTTP